MPFVKGHKPTPEHRAKLSAAKRRQHGPLPTKEERRAKNKSYRESNLDKIKAKDKMYRENNREKSIAYYKKWRSEHPEYAKGQRLKRHGLSEEAYGALLTGQGGKCAACGTSNWGQIGPVIDHNYDTGVVRGIVCNKCNVAIGMLDDDASKARAIAEYLERS